MITQKKESTKKTIHPQIQDTAGFPIPYTHWEPALTVQDSGKKYIFIISRKSKRYE